MTTVTVSAKGWVVIPKEIREKYRIKPGDKVYFVDHGGTIALLPVPEDPIRAGWGIFKGEPSLTEELLQEHAEELAREGHPSSIRP